MLDNREGERGEGQDDTAAAVDDDGIGILLFQVNSNKIK